MKIELKRDYLVIIPENFQDNAFVEDTLGLKKDGNTILLKRVNDVKLGFADNEMYVLKSEIKHEPTT